MQHDDTEPSQPESNDFAEMQRQIEALLNGGEVSISPQPKPAPASPIPTLSHPNMRCVLPAASALVKLGSNEFFSATSVFF